MTKLQLKKRRIASHIGKMVAEAMCGDSERDSSRKVWGDFGKAIAGLSLQKLYKIRKMMITLTAQM